MAQCVGVEVGGKAWVLLLGHEGDGWVHGPLTGQHVEPEDRTLGAGALRTKASIMVTRGSGEGEDVESSRMVQLCVCL